MELTTYEKAAKAAEFNNTWYNPETKKRETMPTKTDQSGAAETDVNVIVSQFKISGVVPGASRPGMYGDFTQLPHDLRDMIEQSRALMRTRNDLPDQLKGLPIEQLLALTPAKIAAIFPTSEPITAPIKEPLKEPTK